MKHILFPLLLSILPLTGVNAQFTLDLKSLDISSFPTVVLKASASENGLRPLSFSESAFSVSENGEVQTISVDCPSRPLTVAIVVDKSLSMAFHPDSNVYDPDSARWVASKTAVHSFINRLRPEDQACLISFRATVTIDQGFTLDHKLLHDKLEGLRLGSGTAMWTALMRALSLITVHPDPKAIILLTDGEDNSSGYTKADVIAAAKTANTRIFTIGLGRDIAVSTLDSVATLTGGVFYLSARGDDLSDIYRTIAGELRDPCTITYTATNPCTDGQRRDVILTYDDGTLAGREDTMYLAPKRMEPAHASLLPMIVADDGARIRIPVTVAPLTANGEPLTFEGILQYPSHLLRYVKTVSANRSVKTDNIVSVEQGAGQLYVAVHLPSYDSSDSTLVYVEFDTPQLNEAASGEVLLQSVSIVRKCPMDGSGSVSRLAVDGACKPILTRSARKLLRAVYPNPARNLIMVRLSPPQDSQPHRTLRLSLCDSKGVELLHIPLSQSTLGTLEFPIDLSAVPAGRYHLFLEDSEGKGTLPVTVVR